MIDQQEAVALLNEEFPELHINDITNDQSNIYYDMHRLLIHTAGKIREHNYSAAGKCFELVNSLHEKGNSVVKNTVENVFVFSFSNLLQSARNERSKLLSIIPASLYALYLSQACHTGY